MTETKDPQTKVVESKDGSVKVIQPKGHKHHGVTVLLDSDDVLREQVGGFTNFLRDYAVVGLAVGFIVGQQANGVMKALVDSFINPWVEVIFGRDLSTQVAIVHHGTQPVPVPWGEFVYTVIEFFFVVVFIYAIVKLFQLDRLKKKS